MSKPYSDNERDELIDLLRDNGMQSDLYARIQADAVLAAGYRKDQQ